MDGLLRRAGKDGRPRMSEELIPLHLHTEFSRLDGAGKAKDNAARCAALGIEACAITDHGVMHGVVDFAAAMRAEGIQPLIGEEFYLTLGPTGEKNPERVRDNYHGTFYAMNETGMENLNRLSSMAHLN